MRPKPVKKKGYEKPDPDLVEIYNNYRIYKFGNRFHVFTSAGSEIWDSGYETIEEARSYCS